MTIPFCREVPTSQKIASKEGWRIEISNTCEQVMNGLVPLISYLMDGTKPSVDKTPQVGRTAKHPFQRAGLMILPVAIGNPCVSVYHREVQ